VGGSAGAGPSAALPTACEAVSARADACMPSSATPSRMNVAASGRQAGLSCGVMPFPVRDMRLIRPCFFAVAQRVQKLRDASGLRRMRIVQFGFSENATHDFMPRDHGSEPVRVPGLISAVCGRGATP